MLYQSVLWTIKSFLIFWLLQFRVFFTILMLCVDHLLLAGSRVQMGVVSELRSRPRLGNEEEDADGGVLTADGAHCGHGARDPECLHKQWLSPGTWGRVTRWLTLPRHICTRLWILVVHMSMDIQNTALHNTCIIHFTYVVIIFAQLSVACISHIILYSPAISIQYGVWSPLAGGQELKLELRSCFINLSLKPQLQSSAHAEMEGFSLSNRDIQWRWRAFKLCN